MPRFTRETGAPGAGYSPALARTTVGYSHCHFRPMPVRGTVTQMLPSENSSYPRMVTPTEATTA